MSDVKQRSEDMQRYRDDVAKQEREFRHARRREKRAALLAEREREAAAVRQANAGGQYWDEIDRRIAEALEHRDALICEAIGEHIADALREERQAIEAEFKTKLLELRTDLTERVIGALETVTKIGRATAAAYDQRERKEFQFAREKADEVIDLPSPLTPRRDIN
jgi:hypothetical protein